MSMLRQQLDEFQFTCICVSATCGLGVLLTDELIPLWVMLFISTLTSVVLGIELALRLDARRAKKVGVFGDKKDEGGNA